jgi:hypothetical protein
VVGCGDGGDAANISLACLLTRSLACPTDEVVRRVGDARSLACSPARSLACMLDGLTANAGGGTHGHEDRQEPVESPRSPLASLAAQGLMGRPSFLRLLQSVALWVVFFPQWEHQMVLPLPCAFAGAALGLAPVVCSATLKKR